MHTHTDMQTHTYTKGGAKKKAGFYGGVLHEVASEARGKGMNSVCKARVWADLVVVLEEIWDASETVSWCAVMILSTICTSPSRAA